MCHRWFANFDWDALLDMRIEAPYIPEEKDPDQIGSADMDGEVEGFASDFLWSATTSYELKDLEFEWKLFSYVDVGKI